MSVGEDLKKEFDLLTSSQVLNEKELFTKLQDSFINLSLKYSPFIEIIHGNRSICEFEIKGKYIKKAKYTKGNYAKKELGDLAFLIVDNVHKPRLLIMQNKKYNKGIGIPTNFNGDLLQLDLLQFERDKIKIHGRDCSILKKKILSSFTSYGIFYKINELEYDMCYCTALDITPLNPSGVSLKRSLVFPYSKIMVHSRDAKGLYEQVDACEYLRDFVDCLLDFKIGEPINLVSLKDYKNIKEVIQKMDVKVKVDENLSEEYNEINEIDFKTLIIFNAEKLKKLNNNEN